MNMNQTRITAVVIGLTVALFSLATATVHAGKTYDNRNLKGEYKYSMNEAEWVYIGSPLVRALQFCTSTGTATADGHGIIQTIGTVRCNNTNGMMITEPTSDTIMYEVQPNGEVLFYDDDPTDPTHGVIVNHERTILIDSSTRTDPDHMYQIGTASKQ